MTYLVTTRTFISSLFFHLSCAEIVFRYFSDGYNRNQINWSHCHWSWSFNKKTSFMTIFIRAIRSICLGTWCRKKLPLGLFPCCLCNHWVRNSKSPRARLREMSTLGLSLPRSVAQNVSRLAVLSWLHHFDSVWLISLFIYPTWIMTSHRLSQLPCSTVQMLNSLRFFSGYYSAIWEYQTHSDIIQTLFFKVIHS